MLEEVTKTESSFNIIPVFLYSSLDDICVDSSKMIEWKLLWNKWVLENLMEINSSKWRAAVKYLGARNGLQEFYR